MSVSTLRLSLRLRAPTVAAAAFGLIAMIVMVGALFPAVGDSFGKLDLPEGVGNLLGGADYGSIRGFLNAEVTSILGPLVVAAVAITSAASVAGEEEAGILTLVLAHPLTRTRFLLARAAAVAVATSVMGGAAFAGLVVGVALAGGGIGIGDLAAEAVHLAFLGFVLGAVALALGGTTGRRSVAVGGAAGFAVLTFLINSFAPLVHVIAWLRYLSPFYYYSGSDPLTNGIDVGDLLILGATAVVFTGLAVAAFRNRDVRG